MPGVGENGVGLGMLAIHPLAVEIDAAVTAGAAGALGKEQLHAGLLPFAERAVIAGENVAVERASLPASSVRS